MSRVIPGLSVMAAVGALMVSQPLPLLEIRESNRLADYRPCKKTGARHIQRQAQKKKNRKKK